MPRGNDSGYIDWDAGREGYDSTRDPSATVVEIRKPVNLPKHDGARWLSIRGEERLGSLVAAAGTIWAVYVATMDFNSLWKMSIMPPGPVEVCSVGILAWLHAKWRRSIIPR